MNNKELAALIREVSRKIESSGLENMQDLVAPLRTKILPGCHVGCGAVMNSSEEGFRLQLEWFAGQLLSMVDEKQWYGINSWINSTEKFTTQQEK